MRPATEDMDPTTFAALAAGATVVTASRRLARQLQADFNRRMESEGRGAWAGADILPWPAWVARIWSETFGLALADPAVAPRVLLSSAQERRLWEAIVNDSAWSDVLLQVPATARTAQEAWQLVHEWRLPLPMIEAGAPNEDTRAFVAWADRFALECGRNGWLDAARVPDLLADAFERRQLTPPARLLFAGFDEFTPQQQHLIDCLKRAGTEIESIAAATASGRAARLACQEPAGEIMLAARWARRILEGQPAARIGIVVPDNPQPSCPHPSTPPGPAIFEEEDLGSDSSPSPSPSPSDEAGDGSSTPVLAIPAASSPREPGPTGESCLRIRPEFVGTGRTPVEGEGACTIS